MESIQISEIEAVFKKAEQLRESGKNDEALQEYTKVVYFAPRHWPAYFHLGVLFGASGHNELAVSLLHRSAALNPNDRAIKNHLADHLMKLNHNEEALVHLKASWSLDSSQINISAPFKVGKILWESNRPREAIEYFDRVLADQEDQDSNKASEELRIYSRWFRSLCRMSLGDYQAAWMIMK